MTNIDSQLKKGFLEFCVLLVIARGRVYASELIDILSEANMIVVEGTIYPLLSRLKREELVAYEWEESPSGPPRKYYVLTDLGRQKLEVLRSGWEGLNESIKTLTINDEECIPTSH